MTLLLQAFLVALLASASSIAADDSEVWDTFVREAAATHGAFGERCATFLRDHHPPQDDDIDATILRENLRLALQARKEFTWCRDLSEELLLNDVLPYAVFDETRENWRAQFLDLGRELVADCDSAEDAVQALNQQLFNRIAVHYNVGRKRPNQSPSESIAQGRATCTGLSILLIDACRAVGIPARGVGIAAWPNRGGNHTWVEAWVGGEWKFTGADEYDANGMNRGWFTGQAGEAIADKWEHAIWATSWQPTGERFPMTWSLENHHLPGVNVSPRYATAKKPRPAGITQLAFRAFERVGGERIVVDVDVLRSDGTVVASVTTRAGQHDMNDMPIVPVTSAGDYLIRVRHDDDEKSRSIHADPVAEQTVDLYWDDLKSGSTSARLLDRWVAMLPEERHLSIPNLAFTRDEARAAITAIVEAHTTDTLTDRTAELDAKVITIGHKSLRLLSRTFGEEPPGGHSLWISMHGGGNAPPDVNDSQWQNQIKLYEPDEGIYVAPRAPTDTWNLWHEGHIDDLFGRLIEDFIAVRGVNPDRVYLMGYSAGGDGVYQLAPRMADRFAAAAMMAGHPNDASPLGLRNLPFMIFMGGDDGAYNRNTVAKRWGDELDALQADDPDGYLHKVTIYDGLGHWMKKRDQEAVPWMAEKVRNRWPRRIVWCQSGRIHSRFYWLAVDRDQAKGGDVIRASVDGQTITIDSDRIQAITVRLSDELVDLDQPVKIVVNGTLLHDAIVKRTPAAIHHSLVERFDPTDVATAEVELSWE